MTEKPLPPGSSEIARWARSRRLGYEARPDEAWFRRWEPHDNIAPPTQFLNACTWVAKAPGHAVLVEPWYAPEDGEPLERTVMAFAAHPVFMRRAAIRVGEHFLTRVAYLENAPPPQVKIGDRIWDDNVTTFAASPSEAEAAFRRGSVAPRGLGLPRPPRDSPRRRRPLLRRLRSERPPITTDCSGPSARSSKAVTSVAPRDRNELEHEAAAPTRPAELSRVARRAGVWGRSRPH